MWHGKLVRIEAQIDPNSNTVQTIIRVNQLQAVDSKARVRSIPLPIGLFVEADIAGIDAVKIKPEWVEQAKELAQG